LKEEMEMANSISTPVKEFLFSVDEEFGEEGPINIHETSSIAEAEDEYGEYLIQVIHVFAPSNWAGSSIRLALYDELAKLGKKARKFPEEVFHWEGKA
jgi:hypothetical protein